MYIQLYIYVCASNGTKPKVRRTCSSAGSTSHLARLILDGPTLEAEDRREDYGERRVVAIGVADEIHLTVVYTDRELGRAQTVGRIISARRSSRRERKIYEASIP